MDQNKFEVLSLDSGADLSASQFKAVAIGGTIAATSAAAIGIQQNRPSATGRDLTVSYFGQMKGYAGAAITLDDAVAVTTSGFLISAASGDLGVGRALTAANSGDVFKFLGNFVIKLALLA